MIIALHGPLQCGKSTLASLLQSFIPNSQRSAFSDPLREEILQGAINGCHSIYEWKNILESMPPLALEGWRHLGELDWTTGMEWLTARPADPRSRALQQWWGQDFRRSQDPDYWIKKHFQKYGSPLLQGTILIEESCRQPNERDYVHMLGGLVIDLAPLAPPTESEAAAMSHSVEQIALSWKGDIKVNMREYFDLSTELVKTQWLCGFLLDMRCATRVNTPLGQALKAASHAISR